MIFFPPNPSWWNRNWDELLNSSHMPWMNTKACHLQNNIFLGEDHSRGVHAPTHMLIASQGTIWFQILQECCWCEGGAGRDQENGKSNKSYIQKGLIKPLVKALCNTTRGWTDLSAWTQTKRNIQSRFFCADKKCKEFYRRGKKSNFSSVLLEHRSSTRTTSWIQVFPSHPIQHMRKPREFLSGTFPVYTQLSLG